MFDITLTFDNGPEPEVTASVLDTLDREQLRATFFVLGGKVDTSAGQALARRAFDSGHWIGNHTYTHGTPLGDCSDTVAVAEIERTERALGSLVGTRRLFRPCGGGGKLGPHLLNSAALTYLQSQRYTCVLWNCVPRDWVDPEGWVEVAMDQVARQPHSVVVLHDLATGAMKRLSEFIDEVRAAGGRFRQEFPLECTPLLDGTPVAPLSPYVRAP